MITIFFLLIIISVVAIFSLQNANPVMVTFLFWQFQASLAIVIFLSILSGALMALIIVFSKQLKKKEFHKIV